VRTVEAAVKLAAGGASATEIARRLVAPRRTVCDWLRGAVPRTRPCPAGCSATHDFAALPAAYVYLLGLYLGDRSIATHPTRCVSPTLQPRHPLSGDHKECASAVTAVAPGKRVSRISHGTWIEVCCYSKMRPCLFPQHGPGKKHERHIELTGWQSTLVERWPEEMVPGLIHSHGSRFQNTGRNGSWPRYSFTQFSDDIRRIFCDTRDLIGERWTASGKHTIYVSGKTDMARLDEFIGPKA
jgi:hypothetical protein